MIIAPACRVQLGIPTKAQQYDLPMVSGTPRPALLEQSLSSNVLDEGAGGAYLAGVLAAQMSKTGTLGIVVSASDENWFKQSGGFVPGRALDQQEREVQYARIGQASYADAAAASGSRSP